MELEKLKKIIADILNIDEDNIICEMAAGAFRAGTDIYLTYFAKEIAGFMDEGRIG